MTYNPDYHHQYYLDNYKDNEARKEYNRVAAANWRRNNRERAMLSAAKARAKKFGMNFDIEVEDIHIPTHCPVLGIALSFTDGLQHDGTPALDRVNNDNGYVKGNVRVISHKANRHKADLSLADIARLYDYANDRK